MISTRKGFSLPSITLFGLALVAVPRAAAAQDAKLDAERFKPAVTHDGFVTAEGSGVRSTSDRFEFGLLLNYGYHPLVVADDQGTLKARYISGRLGFDLLASVTIARPFSIGLDVPFFLAQTGDRAPSFAGIGDLRLVPKLRILDDQRVFGLAIVAELRAPTHVGDFAGGARNVVFWPKLVIDHRFGVSGLRMGANLGALLRERTTFVNVEAGSELTYAAALGYRFGGPDGKVEIGGEAQGALGFVAQNIEELPLEGLFYVKVNPSDQWEITAGPGVGLVPGYGIPTLRAFAGVRFTPTTHDKDHDGIPDDEDKCPEQAENKNGIEDHDGCPDEDRDDDHDGIPNSQDECPTQKETINGVQDEDGCPDGGPAKVIREDGQIQILESVQFKSGSVQIEPQSYSILNQVALVMKANPDIKRLRVEGHTDSKGSREMNLQLSKARARAVRDYLIQRGVRPDRLTSEGYGPDRPKVHGDDDASLSKNRRVEFIIEN